MAKFHTFSGSGGTVVVEVSSGSGGNGSGSLKDALMPIRDIADAFTNAMSNTPSKKRPRNLEVTFGLKALEDGSMVVGSDAASCNFAVKATWSGPSNDESLDTLMAGDLSG